MEDAVLEKEMTSEGLFRYSGEKAGKTSHWSPEDKRKEPEGFGQLTLSEQLTQTV